MNQERSNERTETDERVAENQTAAHVAPVTRKEGDPEVDPSTGLPRGQHDDDSSPLDPGKPLDPFGGNAEAGIPLTRAEEQTSGSIHDPRRR